MGTLKVENGSSRVHAFKVYGGLHRVGVNRTETITDADELSDERIAAFARKGVRVTRVVVESAPDDETGDGNEPATDDGAGKGNEPGEGYAIAEKPRGWFAITLDGVEVTKSLRKDDVEGFDAMTDEDKAAFVDLHKVEA